MTSRKINRTQLALPTLALAVLCAVALALAPVIRNATGAYAGNPLNPFEVKEDKVATYDFLSQSNARGNVDWPITLVFANNSNVNKIKQALRDPFGTGYNYGLGGSKMNGLVNNGNGWQWDTDGGMKTSMCEEATKSDVFHYRVYAPPPPVDRLYNSQWGSFVVASTHIDHNECRPEIFGEYWAGYSERTEELVAFYSTFAFLGKNVYQDSIWMGNKEPFRQQGSHIWSNDGWATKVWVP